jgi:uncharacterized membrane protein YqhA
VNRLVASARYLAVVGVLFGLAAAVGAFAWGGVEAIYILVKLGHGSFEGMASSLVQVMDAFLIAAALLIFSLGLHQLFIAALELPGPLIIHDLDTLEGKLAGVIVLVLAGRFVERVESAADPHGLLLVGAAVAVVSAALVWMTRKHSPRAGKD